LFDPFQALVCHSLDLKGSGNQIRRICRRRSIKDEAVKSYKIPSATTVPKKLKASPSWNVEISTPKVAAIHL
jgi:hypothetical protein